MVTKLQISCAAPVGVCSHAAIELRRFSRGIKNYSRIKPNFYLLSKNGGKVWSLMTHEKYNVEGKK